MPWVHGPFLHVDGSYEGNQGREGIVGLLRDSYGQWMTGFMGSIGVSTILHTELAALFQGLQLAWDMGIRKLNYFMNSQNAWLLLWQQTSPTHRYTSLLRSITEMMDRDWVINVHHLHWEGNQCADFLTKKGCSDTEMFQLLEAPPASFPPLLLADISMMGRGNHGNMAKGSELLFAFSCFLFSFCFHLFYQKIT